METTLQELFRDYTNECTYSACLRPETIRGYKNVFNLFLKIMPEVTGIELLNEGMLNEFFKRIQTRIRIVGKDTPRQGVKTSTIKTQWTKLNVFFKWLNKKNYIEENPLKNIKRPIVRYDDFRRLEDSDLNKIYAAISLHSPSTFFLRRDTFMVSLLLLTGVRRGEFISLQIKDVDLEKKEITIRGETSKSKKTRVLKMHPTLVLHLKDYLRERTSHRVTTEYLMASHKGAALSREGLKHWVKGIKKKSGVRFHLHQFRHTFACKLDEAGVSAFRIQKLLGHSSILMTMRYVRSLRTEDMGEDIDKISI